MTSVSSSGPKYLSLLVTLIAIAERGAILHIDTILLATGAVSFLMLMESQQRAEAGESWGRAGLWLKALLTPAVLPFYVLLFSALIAAPPAPQPVHVVPNLTMPPSSMPAYAYGNQRPPGMPGGPSLMPGSTTNPSTMARPSPSGFGPSAGRPMQPTAAQPSSTPGAPAAQRLPLNPRPPLVSKAPGQPASSVPTSPSTPVTAPGSPPATSPQPK